MDCDALDAADSFMASVVFGTRSFAAFGWPSAWKNLASDLSFPSVDNFLDCNRGLGAEFKCTILGREAMFLAFGTLTSSARKNLLSSLAKDILLPLDIRRLGGVGRNDMCSLSLERE